MQDKLSLRQMIGMTLIRAGQVIIPPGMRRGLTSQLNFNNPFKAVLVRRMGVKNTPRIVWVGHGYNGITVVGKNHLLDVAFGNSSPVTQVDPWYIGLVNDSPTPVFSENDTLVSHAGWSEFTDYSGNRKAWDDANAASKIKGTTSVSTFTISAPGTVNGILVASVASGTSGILWATGSFDTTADVVAADELKITYGIRT